MAILELKNVHKSYGSVDVLKGVDFTISPGQSIAVTGPSGCGKSTLLHILGTLDLPSNGEVVYDGNILHDTDEAARAKFRAAHMGFVFQFHQLLPQCSALENAVLPALAKKGKATAEDDARAEALLKRVGLGDRLHHRPAQLSGGECQRVALVRALINNPGVLLADEPTGSLDETTASDLIDLLLELNRDQNTALVVVTHNPDVAARMDTTLRLRNGTF